MSHVEEWVAPGPGPWMQDSSHNPVSQTLVMQDIYPAGFNKGFEETFALYGLLLDRLAMGVVKGFTYHQPQPFDLPGPDGPPDHDWVVGEVGRRAVVAQAALDGRIWRDAVQQWDDVLKPRAIRRHLELAAGIDALDDAELRLRIRNCLAHVEAMVYQHHLYNCHALVPVGEFMLQAAAWTGRPPMSLFRVLDGYSPVSGVASPEMGAALAALRADDAAAALLASDAPAAEVLAAVRAAVPEVDAYVQLVHYRLLEGFDVVNPTIGERPESLVGRLRAALELHSGTAIVRSDEFAAELRAAVPAEHRAAFDDLLAEARLVYRLRDERGLYSDVSAAGILRLALLELGGRLERAGRLHRADDVLDATASELDDLMDGSATPTADELQRRGFERQRLTLEGPPRYLGSPPHPPPPMDMLPPSLQRVMSAVGFTIDGILGQMDAATGDSSTIVGIPGSSGVYEGTVRLVRSVDDLFLLEPGDVLVAPTTGEAFNSMLHLVGAIVTDHGSFASHAAIVSREMGLPSVVGTIDATRRLADGKRVRVDGTSGRVTLLD